MVLSLKAWTLQKYATPLRPFRNRPPICSRYSSCTDWQPTFRQPQPFFFCRRTSPCSPSTSVYRQARLILPGLFTRLWAIFTTHPGTSRAAPIFWRRPPHVVAATSSSFTKALEVSSGVLREEVSNRTLPRKVWFFRWRHQELAGETVSNQEKGVAQGASSHVCRPPVD